MRTGPLPKRVAGLFFFEDWSMADPHDAALDEAMHTARYALSELTQTQAYKILDAAEAYRHLAGHPTSTKIVVSQLRRVRKAVRETP